MMFLIRFLRTEEPDQKGTGWECQKWILYILYKCTCTLLYSFWTFFSWIRIFRDRIRIFGWSGSGLRNKSSNRIRGKKNLDSKHCILIDCNVLPTQIFFSLHVASTEEYRWLLETNLVHEPDPLCCTFYPFQSKNLKCDTGCLLNNDGGIFNFNFVHTLNSNSATNGRFFL